MSGGSPHKITIIKSPQDNTQSFASSDLACLECNYDLLVNSKIRGFLKSYVVPAREKIGLQFFCFQMWLEMTKMVKSVRNQYLENDC